jgi:hypothetical protein
VAVGVVTLLPTDILIAGIVVLRLAGADTVTVEGREADVVEVLSAVLALSDETKVPWIVSEVLQALSVCSPPASLTVCADLIGVTEAEVEDGESCIGPIGARVARDPIFTVIPPDAPFTCNIGKGKRRHKKKEVNNLSPPSPRLQPSMYPDETGLLVPSNQTSSLSYTSHSVAIHTLLLAICNTAITKKFTVFTSSS